MNLHEMKNAALMTTPGDWEIVNYTGGICEEAIVSRNHGLSLDPVDLDDYGNARVLDSSEWLCCSGEDLRFMVVCSPKKVLELINAYEALLEKSSN